MSKSSFSYQDINNFASLKGLIASLAVCLLALGCSTKSNENIEGDGAYFVTNLPTAAIEENLKRANLVCREEICSPSIGVVGVIEKPTNLNFNNKSPADIKSLLQLKECNGWLASDNLVVTNRHCLSDELINFPDQCSKLMGITFPKYKDMPRETKVCKKILSLSHDRDDMPLDYVVFEIEKINRPSLEISKEGLKDNSTIEVWSFAPRAQNIGFGAEFVIDKCDVVMNSLLLESFNQPFSKNGLAIGCNTVKGQSGSPVISIIDKVPKVVGLHKGKSVRSEKWDEHLGQLKNKYKDIEMLDSQRLFPQHSMFNNIGCLEIPGVLSENPDCEKEIKPNIKSNFDLYADKEKSVNSWLSSLQIYFSFGLEANDGKDQLAYSSIPKCYNPDVDWDKSFKRSNLVLSNDEPVYEYEAPLKMNFRKSKGMDDKYRYVGEAFRGNRQNAKVVFSQPKDKKMIFKRVSTPESPERSFEVEPCDKTKVEFKKISTDISDQPGLKVDMNIQEDVVKD